MNQVKVIQAGHPSIVRDEQVHGTGAVLAWANWAVVAEAAARAEPEHSAGIEPALQPVEDSGVQQVSVQVVRPDPDEAGEDVEPQASVDAASGAQEELPVKQPQQQADVPGVVSELWESLEPQGLQLMQQEQKAMAVSAAREVAALLASQKQQAAWAGVLPEQSALHPEVMADEVRKESARVSAPWAEPAFLPLALQSGELLVALR